MTRDYIWGMKSPNASISFWYIEIFRTTCIREFVKNMNTGPGVVRYPVGKPPYTEAKKYQSWNSLYRKGWRCVKVKVVEVGASP
jgi:hypothetical protein